ncbi:hypothetical protein DFH06DRAFT_1230662 [Mycena polygramma]|nr:hypothetical protein DFH06DRAFT_1230662 [Mycena polygramma]
MHTLPPYPDFPQLRGPLSPTSLTQICRRWREIALEIPELWSAISSLDNNQDGRELRLFELWLKRSRHCPLSIKLGTDTAWASDELVAAVILHRARWQHLKIELGLRQLSMLDGPMPLLRHMDLAVDREPFDVVSVHEVPLLRTLVLNNTTALKIIFPWTQLTSFTLLTIFPPQIASILVQMRNLVHCELHILNFHSHNYLKDIHLPCLRVLTLIHHPSRPATDLLPTFIVPELRSLQIPESFLSPDPIESLTAFMSKSNCTLEELHLTGTKLLEEKPYHEAFPSLRKLLLNNWRED